MSIAMASSWFVSTTNAQTQPRTDDGTLVITDEANSFSNINQEHAQSFMIPASNVPECLEVRINAVTLGLSKQECHVGSDIVVSIRLERNGPDLAVARISGDQVSSFDYLHPTWVTVNYYLQEAVTPLTATAYIVVRPARTPHGWQPNHLNNFSTPAPPTATAGGQSTMTPTPECIDPSPINNSAWPLGFLRWSLNTTNPYGDGQFDETTNDALAKVSYSKITKAKVLVITYDPVITHDGQTKPLHEWIGGSDPNTLAGATARQLGQGSGGRLSLELLGPLELGWERHITPIFPGTNIYSYTNSTWPCPPNGAINSSACVATMRRTVTEKPFDYNEMFGQTFNGSTIRDLVNTGVIDEIWVFAHWGAGMQEGGMAGPANSCEPYDVVGGPLSGNRSAPFFVTGLTRRVTVMGFTYEHHSPAFAAHSLSHRTETTLWEVFGFFGLWDSSLLCTDRAMNRNLPDRFMRIFHCVAANDSQPYGGVGTTHSPVNAPVQDGAPEEYAYQVRAAVPSEEQVWFGFPDMPVPPPVINDVGCGQPEFWPCEDDVEAQRGYLEWWFKHLPKYSGVSTVVPPTPTPSPEQPIQVWNNIWPYIFRPDCFCEIPH
jgi:hypothetical protein